MTAKLILNIAPVTLIGDELLAGKLPFESREQLRELRRRYRNTHAFRFDSLTNHIWNLAIKPDNAPLGEATKVNSTDHLPLIAHGIKQSLVAWLAPGLKFKQLGKRLRFTGNALETKLLTRAVNELRLPVQPWLEVLIERDVDCRVFRDADGEAWLGLVIDARTRNVIDQSAESLLQKGVSVVGRYVSQKVQMDDDALEARLEMSGRVLEVRDEQLILTDYRFRNSIASGEAFLEPRTETLNHVLQVIYGGRAASVIAKLENVRHILTTSGGKQSEVKSTLAKIQKQSFVVGGVQIEVGDFLQPSHARFPRRVTTERPGFLVGPQGRDAVTSPDLGISRFGPYMYMHHTRNRPTVALICESKCRGRVDQFIQMLKFGFPSDQWNVRNRNNPFPVGLVGKFYLADVRFEPEEVSADTSEEYEAAAKRLLNRLPTVPDLAIVQIREHHMGFYGDNNPYLVAKSAFMRAGVPVQAIRYEKIERITTSTAYLLNQIALACYAKLDGVPWLISTRPTFVHEIVIGLGSTEIQVSGRNSSKTRYVGLTTLFHGDGRYLVWGITRECEYEEYVEALIETLKTVIQHVQVENQWQAGEKVRLIFHVYKRLKDCEAEAIKKVTSALTADAFQVEFAFLDVSTAHPYHLFDPEQNGKPYWANGTSKIRGKGVPERGVCLSLNEHRALLHLTGPTDIKTDYQGLPRPLLVELHSESDFKDMEYLLRQLYHFSYISWRSFFPATEPVTISYSRLIASLLGHLQQVTGWDNTQVVVGSLRGRKWFL